MYLFADRTVLEIENYTYTYNIYRLVPIDICIHVFKIQARLLPKGTPEFCKV